MLLIGAPLRFEGQIFNCAVVVYRGRVLGAATTWSSMRSTWRDSGQFDEETNATLLSMLATEISPELIATEKWRAYDLAEAITARRPARPRSSPAQAELVDAFRHRHV